MSLFLTFIPGKIGRDYSGFSLLVHNALRCIDLTVDEGGSAEPTRDKNIIGITVGGALLRDPGWVFYLGRSGGCGPVGQTGETIMRRK